MKYFEFYDPNVKKVILNDWNIGEVEAKKAVVKYLENVKNFVSIYIFFDAESVEQRFITKIWEKEAPFPFYKRNYTRELFESIAVDFSRENNLAFEKIHLKGFADYGDNPQALEKMNNFHFRGHFKDDLKIQREIKEFLGIFTKNNNISIPAGCFIYTIGN